ncbi:MAG: diheme cytochrome c-553 [Candidatus Polarisedimenticolia bacterium]
MAITLAIVVLGACGAASTVTPAAGKQSALQRGEYLVKILACDDCHTPKRMTPEGPVPDMDRRFIGYIDDPNMPPPPQLPPGPWGVAATMDLTAWSGPWGISYGINITPDEDTGIGIWTEEMFVKMIRTGRHMGQSRPILPPMPWMAYAHMTDDDLKAVFAYIMSLPPKKNRVPDPVILPPPAGQ